MKKQNEVIELKKETKEILLFLTISFLVVIFVWGTWYLVGYIKYSRAAKILNENSNKIGVIYRTEDGGFDFEEYERNISLEDLKNIISSEKYE